MAKNSSVYFKNSVKSLNILTIKTQGYQYIMGNLGFRTQLSLLFWEQMKSSDAKVSKCHLKFSSKMIIFNQACIFKFSNFT